MVVCSGMTGPRFMALSALSFAVMSACVKVAGDTGIPILQIIAVRAVISIGLSYASIRRAGVNVLGYHRGLLLARGVTGFLALTCVFYALLNLPLALATLLQYLHPIFTAVLAWLFLREIPDRATLVCVALSLCGMVTILWPTFSAGSAPVSSLFAIGIGLCGAFGSAIAYTIVRRLTRSEHPDVIVIYFPLVCLPGTLLFGGMDFVMPGLTGFLALLGVGVFAQMGQLTLTRAMALDKASRAVSLSYLQIVFAAVIGVIYFGEHPASHTLLGSAFVLLGAAVVFRDRKAAASSLPA